MKTSTRTRVQRLDAPRRKTRTYSQQAVSDMSNHLVDLLRGEQLQREGASLVLQKQLKGQTHIKRRLDWQRKSRMGI